MILPAFTGFPMFMLSPFFPDHDSHFFLLTFYSYQHSAVPQPLGLCPTEQHGGESCPTGLSNARRAAP